MTPGRRLRLAGVGETQETQCHNGYYRCSDHNTFFFLRNGMLQMLHESDI